MTTDAEIRAHNTAAVRRALAAVGDVDAQMAEYTDDAVFEFPYAAPPARIEGKSTITAYLTAALRTFEIRLTLTQLHETTDPHTVIAEFTSDGKVTTTDKPYTNTYITVFTLKDGKIAHQKEFYNPNAATEALTPDTP